MPDRDSSPGGSKKGEKPFHSSAAATGAKSGIMEPWHKTKKAVIATFAIYGSEEFAAQIIHFVRICRGGFLIYAKAGQRLRRHGCRSSMRDIAIYAGDNIPHLFQNSRAGIAFAVRGGNLGANCTGNWLSYANSVNKLPKFYQM